MDTTPDAKSAGSVVIVNSEVSGAGKAVACFTMPVPQPEQA